MRTNIIIILLLLPIKLLAQYPMPNFEMYGDSIVIDDNDGDTINYRICNHTFFITTKQRSYKSFIIYNITDKKIKMYHYNFKSLLIYSEIDIINKTIFSIIYTGQKVIALYRQEIDGIAYETKKLLDTNSFDFEYVKQKLINSAEPKKQEGTIKQYTYMIPNDIEKVIKHYNSMILPSWE